MTIYELMQTLREWCFEGHADKEIFLDGTKLFARNTSGNSSSRPTKPGGLVVQLRESKHDPHGETGREADTDSDSGKLSASRSPSGNNESSEGGAREVRKGQLEEDRLQEPDRPRSSTLVQVPSSRKGPELRNTNPD